MAIARLFECPGWTPDQYDQLIKTVDDRGSFGGRAWPGNLFHWATVTNDGILAVDVSESADAADRLVEEVLGPAIAELGLSLPKITEHQVHNYLSR
jgi:hypothetical protein